MDDAAAAMRRPRAELEPVFSALWVREPTLSLVQFSRVPNGCADLIWCEGRLWILGPHVSTDMLTFRSTLSVLGLRFQPGAAATWLGTSAPGLIGAWVPFEEFGKLRATRIYDALGGATDVDTVASRLQDALLPTLSPQTVLARPCIDLVLQLLERESGKGAFAMALRKAYELSERSVRRETIRIFGYGPKTLERIFRVQRFLRLARSQDALSLASLASAAGFSDQAHMTREVRALAGATPGGIRFVQDASTLPTISSMDGVII